LPDLVALLARLVPNAGLALVSAAALLALGVLLLRAGRRSGPSFVLALFCIIWAAQVVLVRLGIELGPNASGRPLLLASEACSLPLYLLLTHFAFVYPSRLGVVERAWWLPALSAPAVLAIAVLVQDPQSGVLPSGETVWGWAVIVMLALPFFAALVLALARFVLGHARSAAGLRERMFLPALALLSFLSYYVPYQWNGLTPGNVARLTPAGVVIYESVLAVGTVGWLALLALFFRSTQGRSRMAALALASVAAGSAILTRESPTDLLGFWRLVMVLLLGYGVARYQVLDLELRLRSATPLAVSAVVALALWGALLAVALRVAPLDSGAAVPLTLMLALVVGAALNRPFARFIDREFPYIRATEEYRTRRRAEIYRAAVEGNATPGQRDRLAAKLALSAEERALLEAVDTPPPAGTSPGQLLASRYRVERKLADGAHGPVLLAWDERVRERVVLKTYAGLGAAGFAREASVLGDLQHDHIIAVRDVFHDRGNLYVAMEHADQGSLEDLLAARSKLPAGEALAVARDVLAGLAAAHRKGIVHRDVKPANILFRRGRAKVADFGVARDPLLEDAVRALRAQPGTLAWMSPEQARGDPVSPASDVYAVGALLHRMLAGKHYFDVDARGMSEREVRNAVLRREPPPLAGAPQEVQAIVAAAMAKDPSQRTPDAATMLKQVQRALRRTTAPARPAAPSGAPPAAPRAGDATLDVDALGG
jgi:hypothetical protein